MKKLTIRRCLSLLLTLTLTLGLAAPAFADTSAPTPASITLTLDTPTLNLTAGGAEATVTATPTFLDVDGKPVTESLPAITWKWDITKGVEYINLSSPSDTASCTITPVQRGTAEVTVTATAGGLTNSSTCEIVVNPTAATNLSITPGILNLAVNGTDTLSATVLPDTADQTNVSWVSGNTAIAAVSPASGSTTVVTGKTPGQTTVTATCGTLTQICNVTVLGVLISQSSLSMLEGSSVGLTAQSFGVTSPIYEWDSSKPEVAQVSNGQVNAISPGTATITVRIKNTDYTATCTVTVDPNTASVITASADAAHPLSFSSLESDLNSRCRTVLGASLYRVAGLSVSTQAGVLFHKYISADNPGAGVGSSSSYYLSRDNGNALSDITFVPNASYSGTAIINYTGYTSDNRSFRGTIQVSIEKVNDVTYSTSINSPVQFSVGDFNEVCRSRNSRDLSYVSFTLPDSNRGTLYYNYSSGSSYNTKVGESTRYGRTNSPYLSDVSFVPAPGYSGTFSISYTGWDTSGYSYTGRVTIVVSGGGGSGSVSYTVAQNKYITFDSGNFNTACRDATGYNLNYVRFELPSSSQGTLYYNYRSSGSYDSKVSSSTSYYRSSSRYLSNISFVPASDYSGTVNISFTGWSTDSTRFTGTVCITVGSSTGTNQVSYRVAQNRTVSFDSSDFNSVCRDATGYNLNYVRFELPSSSRGTLYYNYHSSGSYDSKVSSSTSYYRSSSRYLSNVSFVPASDYSGTVNISFTGWSTDGDRFTGTVRITVGSGTSGDRISYTVAQNKSLTFDSADFNSVCRDATGYNLNYVRFELPSSSRGTLYYNYRSSGSYDSKVSSSTSYYRSSSPYLSNITFVPASDYSGTVDASFTGWSTDGDRFTGTVSITVGSSTNSNQVSYTVAQNKTITFDSTDFNSVCRDATGYNLNYVRFELPSSSRGVLYYNYRSSGSYDSKVSSSTSYYRSSSPYLSNITFVPASGYAGTASISYTAWSTDGDRFTGTVNITVKEGASASAISYVTGSKAVTFQARDFTTACDARNAGTLKSVQFTLPSSEYGRLYYDYIHPSKYGSVVNASTSYYPTSSPTLSKVSFLPKAGVRGTVSISYTGIDTDGLTYRGTIQITVAPSSVSSHFSDLGTFTWATPSVDYLYENNVVSGVSGTRYAPERLISRGDFVLMLHRALQFPTSTADSFPDVPANSYYAQAIASAKALGIAQGNGGRFSPSAPLTRQDAAVLLQRTMSAMGWSMNDGNSSALAPYSDGNIVSNYAVGAVACMVEHGILQGTNGGALNPRGYLTRGEMAVILHRAITL